MDTIPTEKPTIKKRSKDGCHTCKRRRRKCDQTRPTCLTCQQGGHHCEGYEVRLRWNVGVASRGHLTGAPIPDPEAAPPRIKGRQRDLLNPVPKSFPYHSQTEVPGTHHGAQPPDWALTPTSTLSRTSSSAADPHDFSPHSPSAARALQKELLFEEFVTSGSQNLFATTSDDNPLSEVLPTLCKRSETLYDVCIACQAYLKYGTNSVFYDFYSEALSKYRLHLDHPLRTTDEAIVNASLLLCTIGMMQGTPWTLHLHGIERMLDDRAAMSPLDNVEPAFVAAIEVMGGMDIPRFCVGRQTPSLNAWQRYRSGKLVLLTEESDAVHALTGLPKSLLDLLACDDDELTEEQIFFWPGCPGTFLQVQLWEAVRLTLMLLVRQSKDSRRITGGLAEHESHIKLNLPPTDTLITRALSAIDAVFNGSAKPEAVDSLVLNGIYFPLFFMSTIVMSMEDKHNRTDRIRQWWGRLCEDTFTNTKLAWNVLQIVAEQARQGIAVSPEEIARSKGIEIGLF